MQSRCMCQYSACCWRTHAAIAGLLPKVQLLVGQAGKIIRIDEASRAHASRTARRGGTLSGNSISKRELEYRFLDYVLPWTPGGFRRCSEISVRTNNGSCRYAWKTVFSRLLP